MSNEARCDRCQILVRGYRRDEDGGEIACCLCLIRDDEGYQEQVVRDLLDSRLLREYLRIYIEAYEHGLAVEPHIAREAKALASPMTWPRRPRRKEPQS